MNQPTGTVTFLFTDIEGSTRLAQQYRDAWETLRARHHVILREAVESHHGYVFQIIGDAFCASFHTVDDAVRAAVKAQKDLDAEKWSNGASIKVRMGVHTGTAELQGNGDYLGYMAMSRVQRLMSAAHGGQILVSLAAQELIRADLPEDFVSRDMGKHRLKDIDQPEHIYQLVIPGLAADFPLLKTLERMEHQPAARLAVRLIGKFELIFDQKTVSLSARIAQSLFAYLILNAGTLHRREKLAGMFWPDATEEKAHAYLRHELWRIRKALPTKSKVDYLVADAIHISFNSSSDYWSDVSELKKANEAASIEELMEVLSVVQGELLPGFYDEWIILEREHLQAIYEKKMARLLELLEDEKRWGIMLEWAERWISLGQGPEAAYRALMIAYDGLGDRTKVTSTYQRCVEELRKLDLEPSEQTRALAFKRSSSLNIPIPLTSFIGREKELKEAAALLSRSRLVTLTGSGGVGKTRLAIQVTADVLDSFPDGVWFLDLAPLSDPALVPNTLAELLDLSLMGDSDLSITDLITGYLRSRRALIIFDNCEHLIEACAQLVHAILTSCEHLTILATSREALRVSGEIPYRVPSLALPRSDVEPAFDILAKTESVRLFRERAAVASPVFDIGPHNAPAIAQICKRLGGIPLAIELAAARVNVLTVEQINKRLDDRFNLLTGGLRSALPRHQTLRATIEWSYDLLSEKERLLFQRLAVFVGGWTLEAAEAVCIGSGIEANEVLDLLSQLVHKSLVLVETMPYGSRYRRLETIRQFAREKLLESAEDNALRKEHYAYFLGLAEQADREIHGPDRVKLRNRLELDDDNFRAALEWCLSEENAEAALRLLGAWRPAGGNRFSETCSWFDKIHTLPDVKDYPALYARLLNYIGGSSWLRGNHSYAKSMVKESQAIWLKLGVEGEVGLAESLLFLGEIALGNEAEIETAQSLLEQSFALSQKHGNEAGMARAMFALGHKALFESDYVKAEEQFMKSLAKWKRLGDDFGVAYVFNELGETARRQGDYEQAGKSYEQALKVFREIGDHNLLPITSFNFAWVSLRAADYYRAKALFKESLELWKKDGNKAGIVDCLAGFAGILGMSGKTEQAARLIGTVESFYEGIGKDWYMDPTDQKEFEHYAGVVRGQLDEARFAAAWAEGRGMTLDQAVVFALQEANM